MLLWIALGASPSSKDSGDPGFGMTLKLSETLEVVVRCRKTSAGSKSATRLPASDGQETGFTIRWHSPACLGVRVCLRSGPFLHVSLSGPTGALTFSNWCGYRAPCGEPVKRALGASSRAIYLTRPVPHALSLPRLRRTPVIFCVYREETKKHGDTRKHFVRQSDRSG